MSPWNQATAERRVGTCYYCGLKHDKVEAGGIWHCPNALCTGPGAAYFRSTLKSYRVVENDRHTVDPEEAIAAALALDVDPVVRVAIEKSVAKWRA